MGAIVDPVTGRCDPFARRDHGRVADDGHEIPEAARLTRSTQKPLSALWKVTRQTMQASTSLSG